jgi:hypothetical protein
MLRCTSLINYSSANERAGGWSESWYLDATIDAARQPFSTLQTARATMLPNHIVIVGQRFTTLLDPPNSIKGKSISTNNEYPGGYNIAQDVPQMAMLCRVRGDGVPNTKRYTLRGMPDGTVSGGEFTDDAVWTAGFNQYTAALRRLAFRFRGLDNSQPVIGLQGVLPNGDFILNAPLAFAQGDALTLLRVRDSNGHAVTGTYYVKTATSNIAGTFANWKGATVLGSGSVRKRVFIYPTMGTTINSFLRVIVKKVGRSFFQYRGRRSTTR